MPTKNYTYYDYTISLCSTCLKRISAKIIFEDEKVFMLKVCPTHGEERVLIATDIEYYKRCRNFLKPGESPLSLIQKLYMAVLMTAGYVLTTSSIPVLLF
jgi:uncharacterized radical SAM superfamily Fe-S cluster-containing enzyme